MEKPCFEDRFFELLTSLCYDLAMGRKTDSDTLFELTRSDAGPSRLVHLAEAFGMMLVKVEARELLNEQYAEKLLAKNAELEKLHSLLSEKNTSLEKELEEIYTPGRGIIANCDAMKRVFDTALAISKHPINVLILGASGTGKEVLARFIHRHSPRCGKPFISVNCTAIPESLFESTMFGIEKGVATGVGFHKGLIEAADGGTLFLDEIGEMSMPCQAKLLRALEQREVLRVGANHAVPVDVRLVCATNADLRAAIGEGRFREDLYYRIKVVELTLPPLCERKDDIIVFSRFFLEKACAEMKRPRMKISPEAMDLLAAYSWPGNVRELENEMKRAAALAQENTVKPDDLSPCIAEQDREQHGPAGAVPAGTRSALPFNLQEAEKKVVLNALSFTGGNKSKAAELLGITREGLRKKLIKIGKA